MSVLQISKVFAESQAEGAARLVLLALADVAADSGEITAYKRSYSILASKANCAEGTVRRAIATLTKLGELVVLEQGGGRKSTSYQITLGAAPDEHAPDEHAARATGAPSVDEVSTQGAPDEHPVSPSLFQPDPSTSTAGERRRFTASAFDAFWAVYPNKANKANAARAFGKALAHADHAVIVAGAERYAAEIAGRDGFTGAHAATWLNGRRWEDPPGANASVRTPRGGAGGPVTADRSRPAGRVQM